MVVSCFLEWDMVIVVGLSPMLVRIKKKKKKSNVSGAPINKTHSRDLAKIIMCVLPN